MTIFISSRSIASGLLKKISWFSCALKTPLPDSGLSMGVGTPDGNTLERDQSTVGRRQ